MFLYSLNNVTYYIAEKSSFANDDEGSDYEVTSHSINEASINGVYNHVFFNLSLLLTVNLNTIKFGDIVVEINLNENEALYYNDIIYNYLLFNCLLKLDESIYLSKDEKEEIKINKNNIDLLHQKVKELEDKQSNLEKEVQFLSLKDTAYNNTPFFGKSTTNTSEIPTKEFKDKVIQSSNEETPFTKKSLLKSTSNQKVPVQKVPVHIQRERARLWAEKEFKKDKVPNEKSLHTKDIHLESKSTQTNQKVPVHIQRERARLWAEKEFKKDKVPNEKSLHTKDIHLKSKSTQTTQVPNHQTLSSSNNQIP